MSTNETTIRTEIPRAKRSSKTLWMVQVAILGAVAVILMLLDFPLPIAPSFYKLDFSEVPVLVGTFALGPLAGVAIELIKVLLNLVLNGTDTAGVGELANFIMGCAFVVPAGIIYKYKRTKLGAFIGLLVGTLTLSLAGSLLNGLVLLPVYATAYKMPMEALVAIGSKVNANITSVTTFVMYAVLPFNLIKGILVSGVVMVIYKPLRTVIKNIKK